MSVTIARAPKRSQGHDRTNYECHDKRRNCRKENPHRPVNIGFQETRDARFRAAPSFQHAGCEGPSGRNHEVNASLQNAAFLSIVQRPIRCSSWTPRFPASTTSKRRPDHPGPWPGPDLRASHK